MAEATKGANSVIVTNEDMVRTGPGTLAGRYIYGCSGSLFTERRISRQGPVARELKALAEGQPVKEWHSPEGLIQR